jgi:uncharacterized protein
MADNHLLRNLALLISLVLTGGIIGSLVGFALVDGIFNVDLLANIQLLEVDKMDSSFAPMIKFLQVIQVLFSFIIPAQVYALIRARQHQQEFMGFQKTNFLALTLGVLIIFCSAPLISFLSSINEGLPLPSTIHDYMVEQDRQNKLLTELMLTANSLTDLFVNLTIVALLAAFSEEILFRGVLQKILTSSIQNIHLAIFIGAFAFSFFHFQWSAFIPRLVLGLFLGYAMAYTKSIWVPILMHFTNNGMAVLLDFLFKRELINIDPNSNDYFGLMGVGISLIATAIIVWYSHKRLLNGERLG